MKRASLLVLLTVLALTAAACGRAQNPTTSETPRPDSTAESPQSQAQGGDCELTSEEEVETIVGTDVVLSEGSCKYDGKDESKGISGTWSVEPYSESAWTGAKAGVGGERHDGFGDEAYSNNSGIIAQMIVKKGDKFLIITTSSLEGKARDHLLALAEKLVAEM